MQPEKLFRVKHSSLLGATAFNRMTHSINSINHTERKRHAAQQGYVIMLSVAFYLLRCWMYFCWVSLFWASLYWVSLCWASWCHLFCLCGNDEAKRSFAGARPEEERKFFVHDRLGALLLRSLDLLEAHVPETDRQLSGGLAVKQFSD